MTIEIIEQVKSQQVSDKQATRLFICMTTAGETSSDVKSEIKATITAVFDAKGRKDITVNPTERPDLFYAVVSYGKGNSSPTPSSGLKQTSSMSFQYHTAQIFNSLEDTGWEGDESPDLPTINNGIQVDPNTMVAKGTTVQKAGLVMGLGYVVNSMPMSYVQDLAELAMHVNSSTLTTPIGTIGAKMAQFVDMNYTQQPSGNFNLSLKYKIEFPSKYILNDVNGGSAMSSPPHWHFWSQEQEFYDETTEKSILVHPSAWASRIYPESNLNDTLPPSGIIVT